jgi:hypothetical protein
MSCNNIVADGRESAANTIVDDSTVVIAHPMGDQRAPLGLERPLELRGDRSRMVPSGMPSAIGIDHIPALRSFVADACRRRMLAGGHGYHQPPLALVGEKGVGKGFASLWIARNAGVPLFRMTVDDRFWGNRTIGNTARSMPTPPIMAMAATLCANPVIVVELDVRRRITAEAEKALTSMIDPRRNARWIDEEAQTIFDFSHVSWIIEVQNGLSTSSLVADVPDAPVMPAAPSPVLAALVQETGLAIKVDAPRQLEDLRRLDVAVEVCAAAGETRPEVVAAAHVALCSIDRPAIGHVACDVLVRSALRALDQRRDIGGGA